MKLLSMNEYLMDRIKIEDLSSDQMANINTLVPRINDLLIIYNKPWVMNSGFRTKEDQQRINPKALNSKHCEAAAIDIGDRDHNVRYFVLMHLDLLEKLGLWMEDPAHTPTWVHLQCIPPKSDRRIFIP